MSDSLTRRGFLGATGAMIAAPSLARAVSARKRTVRFAHFTDIHVQPERQAAKGMEHALAHMQSLKDKPTFLVTGGDQIMDAFGANEERTMAQWKIWTEVMKSHCKIPAVHCIGNHDLWRGEKKEGENDPLYARRLAMEMLSLERRYTSFDRFGWHWIVLDSTFLTASGYTAKLDDEQFEWLKGDLEGNRKRPTIIVSHEPLFTATVFLDGDNEKTGNWVVPGAWMHIDFRRIKDLLKKHPQVKLAISGHVHLADRVDYLGVTYLCNGAVSGGWWGGNYQEFGPAYAVIDLFDDGTFEHELIPTGWEAKP